MIFALLVEATVFLAVIAWLCFAKARLHSKLADLNSLVARMLRAGAYEGAAREAELFRIEQESSR